MNSSNDFGIESKEKIDSHSKIQGNVSRATNSKVPPHLYRIDTSSWCDKKGTTEDLWQRSSKKRRKRK